MSEQRSKTEVPELEARLTLFRVSVENTAFAPLPKWPMSTAAAGVFAFIATMSLGVQQLGSIGTVILFTSFAVFAGSLLFIIEKMSRKLSALSDLVSVETAPSKR